MINKNKNISIKITLNKRQNEWLETQCKKTHLTKSKFIAWVLSKKANEIIEYLYLKSNKLNDEQLEKLIEIVKTPWIDK